MAKSLRKLLKTSPKRETEGITLESANTRVLLRRAGGANVEYNAMMAAIHKEHGRALKIGAMPDAKANAMMYEVYAKTVIAGWETDVSPDDDNPNWVDGLEGPGGEIVPASVENIIAYFTEVPEFWRMCKETAEEIQYYSEDLASSIAGK